MICTSVHKAFTLFRKKHGWEPKSVHDTVVINRGSGKGPAAAKLILKALAGPAKHIAAGYKSST